MFNSISYIDMISDKCDYNLRKVVRCLQCVDQRPCCLIQTSCNLYNMTVWIHALTNYIGNFEDHPTPDAQFVPPVGSATAHLPGTIPAKPCQTTTFTCTYNGPQQNNQS